MIPSKFIFKSFRRIITTIEPNLWKTEKYVQLKDQKANDFILSTLEQLHRNPVLIAKFGTNELNVILYNILKRSDFSWWCDNLTGRRHSIECELTGLLTNMGFFPADLEYTKKFTDIYLKDAKNIDILGSYIWAEKYISEYLLNSKRINLEGYYAPFLWKNPWTKYLKGKRVLVVHPFTDSIAKQYERREKLFENKDVLPEFADLKLIKSVQSIAGTTPDLNLHTWYEAIQFLEDKISSVDFDIALIGAGAYGLPLAAYIKRMGKDAIHLAGWTQMLFGIYGNRWINDQPKFAKFINKYWIRPSDSEKPTNFTKVENGCYW
jgi:glycosyltransferase involved in cell wall biosynthesis